MERTGEQAVAWARLRGGRRVKTAGSDEPPSGSRASMSEVPDVPEAPESMPAWMPGVSERIAGATAMTRAVHGTASTTQPAQDTFERLFLREYPRVVAAAYRVLRDVDAAEDAAQEAFLAYGRLNHAADAPFAAAWLHAAAVHQALNQLRGERRRQRRETDPSAAPGGAGSPPSDDPEGLVEAAETRAEVRRALARMAPRSATVLILRHSGLSYVEVATALGIPANQVGTLLRRAEASLRKELHDAPSQ